MLQEFNIQIRDKKGVENVVVDHLSKLTIAYNTHNPPIFDEFPEESLLTVIIAPWYAHIANFFGNKRVTSEVDNTRQEVLPCKGSFVLLGGAVFVQVLCYKIIRKCVPKEEHEGILSHCYDSACGGHFASQKTTMKVLHLGFYWPSLFKNAYTMCKQCDKCQRLGKISRRHMMPLNPILVG